MTFDIRTTALLLISLAAFVILLICKKRHGDNRKLTAAIFLIQAVLWCLIAVDYWHRQAPLGKFYYLMYAGIVILSLSQAFQALRGKDE